MQKTFLMGAMALALLGAGCGTSTPVTPSSTVPNLENPTTTEPLPMATSTSAIDPRAEKADLISVSNITNNQHVTSPLTVEGQARGNWYFEASFPVELRDSNNTLLAQKPAQAIGNWMTTSFVPFSVVLTFPAPITATGTLILRKDNPSGEPANDDQLSIPVTF